MGLRSHGPDAGARRTNWRVRLGIGHPGHKDSRCWAMCWGISAPRDKIWLVPLLDAVADAARAASTGARHPDFH